MEIKNIENIFDKEGISDIVGIKVRPSAMTISIIIFFL